MINIDRITQLRTDLKIAQIELGKIENELAESNDAELRSLKSDFTTLVAKLSSALLTTVEAPSALVH